MKPQELLLEAVKTGDITQVKALLKGNPELVSTRTDSELTVLMLAKYYGQEEIVGLVLQTGIQLDVFEAAAVGQTQRLAQILKDQPELANAFAVDGFTPLGLAAFFGNLEAVKIILACGAQVNQPSLNELKACPLQSAVAGRHLQVVEILLANGADVNVQEQGGFTPLHGAAENGQVDMAHLLLQHGADPNRPNNDGVTPLALAQAKGYAAVADLLKQYGEK